jgi:hypothetical protein
VINDGVIGVEDDDGIEDDCDLLHQTGQAPANNMAIHYKVLSEDKVELQLTGAPYNPLAYLAGFFGTADWNLTLTIDVVGEAVHWHLKGVHDGFPAYEVYIDNTEIYAYKPVTADDWWQLINGVPALTAITVDKSDAF